MATNKIFVENAIKCEDFYKIYMVPVSELRLDNSYQRDNRTVTKLVANWKDSECDPLKVNYREDEDLFYIIDGGHRYEAALAMGKKSLPCTIRTNMTLEEEAQSYASQDKFKKQLVPYDRYKAALVHHDPSAMTIKELCDHYHIRVMKRPQYSKGAMKCLGTMWRLIREGNELALDWVFHVIAMANWHFQKGAYGKEYVLALFNVYNTFKDKPEAKGLTAGLLMHSSPEKLKTTARAAFPQCEAASSAMSEYIVSEVRSKLDNKVVIPMEVLKLMEAR